MRRRLTLISIALTLGTLSLTAGAPGAVAKRERLPRSAGPARLDVALALARHQRALERFASRVSNPTSPRYGRYLRPREVGLRFGAGRASVRAVRRFLRNRHLRGHLDITRSFVEALVPARRGRRLFGKPGRGRVPKALRGRVRAVLVESAEQGQLLPRTRRSGPHAAASGRPADQDAAPPHVRTGTPAGCHQGRNATFSYEPDGPVAGPAFTPNQLEDAYRAAPLHGAGVTGRGVRVAIYGAGGFGRRELRAYARCFGFRAPTTRLVKVGTRNAGATSGETALDLQMVALMAPGIRALTVYSIGSGFFPVGFSAMLDPGNAPGGHRPHVISVSQGDCETGIGRGEVRLTEHVLAAAAATGVTVAAGSGDNGSFCPDGPDRAFYPSASRWMTSVGGTSLALDASNRIVDEVPWNDRSFAPGLGLGGGGGFGRLLRRPEYQRGLRGSGNHRSYPDLALVADSYPGIATYCHDDPQGNCDPSQPGNPFQAGFGTSAATPLFAGIVALADQRLLTRGRPPIGFANPLLYRLGRDGDGVLRDVVEGSNSVFWPTCCSAVPGYDRASGWGSVNARRLAAIALRRGPRRPRAGAARPAPGER